MYLLNNIRCLCTCIEFNRILNSSNEFANQNGSDALTSQPSTSAIPDRSKRSHDDDDNIPDNFANGSNDVSLTLPVSMDTDTGEADSESDSKKSKTTLNK